MKHVRRIGLALMIVIGAGCDQSQPSAGGSTPAWLVEEAPAGAVSVAAIKADAREGDHVVLRGRIGGRSDPISKGSAVFVVMDPDVPSCADNPDDHCPTPWDYCCEAPESIKANNATIQIVDESGNPIESDLSKLGFKPLDTVIVTGTVGPRPTDDVLTIRATRVHRVGG